MQTYKQAVYLTAWSFDHQPPGEIKWSVTEVKLSIGGSVVGQWEHEVSLPIPDEFDPVPAQVAALEAQKLAALADYRAAVGAINDRLQKLLAIECSSEAA